MLVPDTETMPLAGFILSPGQVVTGKVNSTVQLGSDMEVRERIDYMYDKPAHQLKFNTGIESSADMQEEML